MTVPVQDPITTTVANGSTTEFPFGFLCFNDYDLVVRLDGVEVDPASYTVSGLGDADGGTVTLSTAPAAGVVVTVMLQVVLERTGDYQTLGDLFAKTLNRDLDRIWLALQSSGWDLSRALRLGATDIDGQGSYRANQNRIQDVADAEEEQDAVNLRTMEAALAGVTGGYGFFQQSGAGAVERTFQDKMRDAYSVKDFGAVGDGTTDDTAAILAADAAAYANGRALYFPAGVYMCGNISVGAVWVGDGMDLSILRRMPGTVETNFVTAARPAFCMRDICLDGNKANTTSGCNVLHIPSSTVTYSLLRVRMTNAKATVGWGAGLVADALSTATPSYIMGCHVLNHDASGASISQANNLTVLGNTFSGNALDGLSVNNFDPTFTQKLFFVKVLGNHFVNNGHNGCVMANFVQNNNLSTPVYGTSNPEGLYPVVEGNTAYNNGYYGFAISGFAVNCSGNVAIRNSTASISTANYLFNAQYSLLASNICDSSSGCGIDAGGSESSVISSNTIRGSATVGLNLEANNDVLVSGNFLFANGPASGGVQILIERFGGASPTQGFPLGLRNVTVSNNHVSIDGTRIGIEATNNPASVLIEGNKFACSSPSTDLFRCVRAIGTNIKIKRNTVLSLGQITLTPSGSTLEIPDVLEYGLIGTAGTINSLQTSSALLVGTGVAYCNLTAGGSGYTSVPTVSFSGGGGSGASATALISASGAVTGIRMLTYGTGYTSAPTVTISGGGGSGATATAQWKLPVPEERELTLLSTAGSAITITRAGAVVVENPSTADISLPVRGCLTLIGTFGQWYLKSKNF